MHGLAVEQRRVWQEQGVNKVSDFALTMASCEHAGGSSRSKHYDLCVRKSTMAAMWKSYGERVVGDKRPLIINNCVVRSERSWTDK